MTPTPTAFSVTFFTKLLTTGRLTCQKKHSMSYRSNSYIYEFKWQRLCNATSASSRALRMSRIGSFMFSRVSTSVWKLKTLRKNAKIQESNKCWEQMLRLRTSQTLKMANIKNNYSPWKWPKVEAKYRFWKGSKIKTVMPWK